MPHLCCIVSPSQFSTFRMGRRISMTAGGVEGPGEGGRRRGALSCLSPRGTIFGFTFSWPKETECCSLDKILVWLLLLLLPSSGLGSREEEPFFCVREGAWLDSSTFKFSLIVGRDLKGECGDVRVWEHLRRCPRKANPPSSPTVTLHAVKKTRNQDTR